MANERNGTSSDIAIATVPTPERLLSATDANAAHGPPTASFVRFPLLPLELREQIWKFCLPPGRLIKVKPTSLKDKNIFMEYETFLPDYIACEDTNFTGRPRVLHMVYHPMNVVSFGGFVEADTPYYPGFVHACRESRRIALATFELCLPFVPHEINKYIKTVHQRGEPHPNDPRPSPSSLARPGIWFQPALDTIYFRSTQEDEKLWWALSEELPGADLMTKFDNVRSVAFDELYSWIRWMKHPADTLGLGGPNWPPPSLQREQSREQSRAWSGIREVILSLSSERHLSMGAYPEDEDHEKNLLEWVSTRQYERDSVSGPYPPMIFMWDKDLIAKFDK